ncbi:hypothetical protein CRUP_013520, partial [Coryphaenoides rupestris]
MYRTNSSTSMDSNMWRRDRRALALALALRGDHRCALMKSDGLQLAPDPVNTPSGGALSLGGLGVSDTRQSPTAAGRQKEMSLPVIKPIRDVEYKAIVNPMDIQTSSAVVWTCLKAVSIWLLSVLLAVPEAIFSQVVAMGNRDSSNVTFVNCVPYPLSNQMHPKIHSVLIFLVYFLVPLGVISVYYYHIARTLIRSAHDMPGEVSEHTKRQ